MTRLFLVDAFTARPFAGNPAAVCVLERARPARWMASLARELGYSETAFLRRLGREWSLRWFTPRVEAPLCGHATLGSAHALWEAGLAPRGATLRFRTRAGLLTAVRRGAWIELDFPVVPLEARPAPRGLAEAVGRGTRIRGHSGAGWLAEVPGERALRRLRPDLDALARLAPEGVIATCRPDRGPYDFLSRVFSPAEGIPEDPVTGSAHCCLAPFWAVRMGKTRFRAYQASERGGEIQVRLEGGRVKLLGRAVRVFSGSL